MKLRSGNYVHFIQRIRSGRVEKVHNVDSRGRPGLVFKALKDIYNSEYANIHADLSAHQSENKYEYTATDTVKRKTKEQDTDSSNYGQETGNEDDGSDSDDIKLTLKQLKKKSKTKKRKVTHYNSVTVKQEYADWEPEEDETDLKETISSWKSKVSKKSKGKMKSLKKCAPVLTIVKTEPILISKDSLQSDVAGLPSAVEVDNSVTECSESMVMTSEVCDSSDICSEEVYIETTEVNNDSLSGSQLILLENEICVLNEIDRDYMENCYVDGPVEYLEMPFPQAFSEAGFPFREQSLDLHMDGPVLEITMQGNEISEHRVPVMMTNECTARNVCELNDYFSGRTPLYLEYVSASSASDNSSSSWVSTNCLNNDEVCGEDYLLASQGTPGADVGTEHSQDKSPVVLLEVLAATKEQCRSSSPDNEESDSPDMNRHCDSINVPDAENLSLTEPYYHPERLLSTRKVISPTSQERLCQAMNGAELIEDVDNYKCKGKLHLKDATGNTPVTKGQGAENTKIETHLQGLGAVNGSKVNLGPKRTIIKKKSPPRGNKKSPGLSRSLSNFSTGTKSLQKCSESAIAFSQRQMHDFECLATKLMHELNSMKDIVERKLHCEMSPADILKYDVNEVKMAIKSANKAEETTRKWLSMMTRDCNRFCTIMKLPEKGEVASPNKTHKERRKITFADEAGGVLCHVKVFDDDMASLNSQ